jgi:hypothetical protein
MHRLILSSVLLTGFAASMPAGAETLSKTLDGTQLELHLSCVKSVTIDPQPDLQGKVEITASAESHDELDPIDFTGGTTARIQRQGQCGDSFLGLSRHQPSLTLAIKIPPAMPIDLHDAGSGNYTIGPVGGPLKIELAGSGDIKATDGTALDLRINGSGSLNLDRLDGPGKIDIRGSGDVTIEGGVMPTLAIDLRGSGDIKISGGEIGTLAASIAGSGDIHIDGTVKDASLSSAGSGDIEIAKATGSVQSSKAGSGSIHIGK